MATKYQLRKLALQSMPVEEYPKYGEMFHVIGEINSSRFGLKDEYYMKYVEGVININSYDSAILKGDFLLYVDNRKFKFGREFCLMFCLRLQKKVYVPTYLFGTQMTRVEE